MLNEWIDYSPLRFPISNIQFITSSYRFCFLNNSWFFPLLSSSTTTSLGQATSNLHTACCDNLLHCLPAFIWASRQSILLPAMGVTFEYRNVVISCLCLNHSCGFLWYEGQDYISVVYKALHGLVLPSPEPYFLLHSLSLSLLQMWLYPVLSKLKDHHLLFVPLGICFFSLFATLGLFIIWISAHMSFKETYLYNHLLILPIPHLSIQGWVCSATWPHRIILFPSLHLKQILIEYSFL